MKRSPASCPSDTGEVSCDLFSYIDSRLAVADLLDSTVQMVQHIWQLQAIWPTCWTWWIVKRPWGCTCWPSQPHAFFSFFSIFVSSSPTYCLCLLITRIPLHTLGYVRLLLGRSLLTVGGSPAPSEPVRSSEQGWGTGARCLPPRQRWTERGPCSWHTRFLQHAVTSLQLPPLSDVTWQVRVCVCVVSCFLQLVGGGVRGRRGLGVMRSWGSTMTNRIWIGLNFRGKDAWEKRGRG